MEEEQKKKINAFYGQRSFSRSLLSLLSSIRVFQSFCALLFSLSLSLCISDCGLLSPGAALELAFRSA